MEFTNAVALLQEEGYIYYGRLMISGCDFDNPNGERVFLTEGEVIKLASEL